MVRVAYLTLPPDQPDQLGDPLDLATRFVAAPARPKPWLSTSDRLARWTRVLEGDFPATFEVQVALELAFPAGSTAVVPLPAGLAGARLRVGARSSRELEVALALGDLADPHVALLEAHPRSGGEALYLSHRPAPTPGSDELAREWFLEVRAVPVAELQDGYAKLAVANDQLALASGRPDALSREARALGLALEAVRSGSASRPAVVHLARLLRTPLAADLALVASEAELAEFIDSAAENFREQFSELPIAPDAAALALERNAYRFALQSAAAAANPAPDADAPPDSRCGNLLETHAGRASAFPEALADLLARATSLSSLERMLVEENSLWLSDNDPASRVVAFDWLARRDAAPAGFDPLASRDQRRAALAAANEAAAAPAAPQKEDTRSKDTSSKNTGSKDNGSTSDGSKNDNSNG